MCRPVTRAELFNSGANVKYARSRAAGGKRNIWNDASVNVGSRNASQRDLYLAGLALPLEVYRLLVVSNEVSRPN